MENNNKIWQVVKAVIGSFFMSACLMLGMWGFVIYENTLIDWWIPALIAFAMAVVLAKPFGRLWKKASFPSVKWLDAALCVMAMGSLSYFGILAVNTFCADDSAQYEERVLIVEKRKSVHSRTHRVGRHSYRSAGSYYKYHFELQFSDGRLKEQTVSSKEYKKAKSHGDTVTVVLKKGYFGYPVVEEIKPLPSQEKAERNSRRKRMMIRRQARQAKAHADSIVGAVENRRK